MTLNECYSLIGGDFDELLNALGSEGIIQKFLLKLIDENTHLILENSLKEKNYEEAFRASHTIKGITLNLCLKRLFSFVNPLTEALRHQDKIDEALVLRLYEAFKLEYDKTIEVIKEFKDSL